MLFEISELWSILLNGNMQCPEMEQREYRKNKGDGLRKDGCCSGALSFNFAFVFIQSELLSPSLSLSLCDGQVCCRATRTLKQRHRVLHGARS